MCDYIINQNGSEIVWRRYLKANKNNKGKLCSLKL